MNTVKTKFTFIVLTFILCGTVAILNLLSIVKKDDKILFNFIPKLSLGLDIVGGAHFSLHPDFEKYFSDYNTSQNSLSKGKIKDMAMTQAVNVVRNRIDAMGTKETNIYRNGEEIIVQIPSSFNISQIRNILSKTAKMDFYILHGLTQEINDKIKREMKVIRTQEGYMLLDKNPVVSGQDLSDAKPSIDSIKPGIGITFNAKGASDFAKATIANTGRQMAIVIDDKIISAPVINEPILSGKAIISGNFTPEEMNNLAISLKSGSLPVQLEIAEEKLIAPEMGTESIKSVFKALAAGVSIIITFMISIYRFKGLIASIGILMNIFITVTIFACFDITLTLPGMAALLLGVAMAVDANVLIYENMKEYNVKKETSLSLIEKGYSGAMSAIIDANITTVISMVMLLSFGSFFIKSFSISMIIGILASFFTSVYATKNISIFIAKSKSK